MKKAEVSWLIVSVSREIRPVEVVSRAKRTTDIRFAGVEGTTRVSSDNLFPTWDDARLELVSREKINLRLAQSELDRQKAVLAKVASLKKPALARDEAAEC